MSAPPTLTGLLAWPAGHSLSPLIHRYWLQQLGLAGDYQAHAVAPEQLADTLSTLIAGGYRGLNLTLPHKTAVLPLLQHLSPLAAQIGAVNTMVIAADGGLAGENTDVAGFVAPLTAARWQGEGAVLLGAGGAARAVVAGLAGLGVQQITVAARRSDAVAALAQDLRALLDCPRLSHLDWDSAADAPLLIPPTNLLINSTPLGMQGQKPLQLRLDRLPANALVYDLVYRPHHTPLLLSAKAAGLATQDGLEMLLAQAAPAFAAWHGVQPIITDDLRRKLRDAAAPQHPSV